MQNASLNSFNGFEFFSVLGYSAVGKRSAFIRSHFAEPVWLKQTWLMQAATAFALAVGANANGGSHCEHALSLLGNMQGARVSLNTVSFASAMTDF